MVSLSQDARQNQAGAGAAPLALGGAALAVALAFLYAPLWAVCWKEWWREDSAYSHGVLIPFLALFMVWHRRDAWSGSPGGSRTSITMRYPASFTSGPR